MLDSSMAAAAQWTYRDSHVIFPLLSGSLQSARKHPYITLYVCWTITCTWLVLGCETGQKLLATVGHHSEKGGENGFNVEILPIFPLPYSSFRKYVCHSSYKYSSSALLTLSLISYPFIFSPFLYSPSLVSCYLQKFMRKFHSLITLLVFSF